MGAICSSVLDLDVKMKIEKNWLKAILLVCRKLNIFLVGLLVLCKVLVKIKTSVQTNYFLLCLLIMHGQ